MSATTPMRTTSMASIVRRRFHRPTRRVTAGPATSDGASRSTRIPPTAVDEPVRSSTSAMSAIVPSQSPSDDTV